MAKTKRMGIKQRKAIKSPDAFESVVAGAVKTTADNSALLIKAGVILLVAIVVAILFFSFRSSQNDGFQSKLAQIDEVYMKEQSNFEDKMRVQQEKFREVLSGMAGKAGSQTADLQKKLAALRTQADAIKPDYSESAAMYAKFFEENKGTKQAGIAALQVAAQHLQAEQVNPEKATTWLNSALEVFAGNPVLGPQIRQALMGLYEDDGKTDLALAMAEKNIRSPARHVKDFASLTKARILAATDIDQAKKILDGIVSDENALYKDQARALRSSL